MIREPVKSSNIASVGFELNAARFAELDPTGPTRGTLEVEFQPAKKAATGEIWRYYDVPAALHAGLLAAPSIGSFFHKAVRMGGFRSEKVGDVSGEVEALYRSWDLDSLRGMQTAQRADLDAATDDERRRKILVRIALIDRILTERGETP